MRGAGYFTTGQAAARLGLPRWRLAYLIERGAVPGPSVQVPGRRLFSQSDLQAIRQALRRTGSVVSGF
jgi:DNA-binding transcriptional MerR regulator